MKGILYIKKNQGDGKDGMLSWFTLKNMLGKSHILKYWFEKSVCVFNFSGISLSNV